MVRQRLQALMVCIPLCCSLHCIAADMQSVPGAQSIIGKTGHNEQS